jgi:uncharacterized membrane protein YesL
MKTKGLTGLLIGVSEWIMRFGTLTLFWLSFTLSGLVVFGLMPATAAMFSVVRKWVDGEEDVSIFPLFLASFKRDFLKTNLIGLVLLSLGLIIFVDWRFFSQAEGAIYKSLSYLFVFLSILYFITFIYLFPVYVHYEYKLLNYIKNSFLIALLNPVATLSMIGLFILYYFAVSYLPFIVLLFGTSVMAFAMMWTASRAFSRMAGRQNMLGNS